MQIDMITRNANESAQTLVVNHQHEEDVAMTILK
jgi:hypothetical protein